MRGIFILGTPFFGGKGGGRGRGHLHLNIYGEIICENSSVFRMVVIFITKIIGRKLSLVLYGVMLYQPRPL